jgi:pimeloyl-ACP methyl ester carboxylesterase
MILLTGCATPIGTRSVGIRQTYEQINVNAIKTDIYSDATRSVLHRFYLEEQYKKDPAATIVTLHGLACEDGRRDLLYALAELAYLTGRHYTSGGTDGALGPKNYFLASAVYAYLYLLGDPEGDPPDPYDRRVRTASDFYNTALAQSLLHRDRRITSQSRRVRLPVGTLLLELDQSRFLYDLKTLELLIPADTLSVRGLSVRDRKPGLGAPFIAVEKKVPGTPVVRSFPGTLFLRVEGDIRDLEKEGRARVELYATYDVRKTDVHGKTIPLENDLSAQLAYSLNQPYFWDLGKRMFFKGPVMQPGLFSIQSYNPKKIPVVFVHGTFSSPIWWAEMFNTLRADPVLWEKYQFWFYLYDSSKQLVQSALDFRNSLSDMKNALDPGNNNPFLEKMVIVGHSQGGLLAKLTATETGDTLIRAAIQKDPDELDISPKELAMLQEFLVYSPLPFVRRVIFISTPHRGSYLAMGWVR